MTGKGGESAPLLAAIDDALALLGRHGAATGGRTGRGVALTELAPLPSLLDQCRALQQQSQAAGPEPIRTLHHFACTGGTLIAKCLTALPNTFILSEIDPLSTLGINPQNPVFAPSDLIRHLRYSLRPVEDETIVRIFLAGLEILADRCQRNGQRLVLRDHAHSQFCVGPVVPQRPTLQQIVARIRPVRAVLTVRHPMESYQSLLRNKWEHFQPGGIEDYSRRYIAFLEAHPGVETFRYEDFVADPGPVLAAICAVLDLPYDVQALDLLEAIHLTGDSGRSGAQIAPRPPRPVPDALAADAAQSAAYAALCRRMGY